MCASSLIRVQRLPAFIYGLLWLIAAYYRGHNIFGWIDLIALGLLFAVCFTRAQRATRLLSRLIWTVLPVSISFFLFDLMTLSPWATLLTSHLSLPFYFFMQSQNTLTHILFFTILFLLFSWPLLKTPRSWLKALAYPLTFIYLFSLYLVFGVYYHNSPSDIVPPQILNQAHCRWIRLPFYPLVTGRKMLIASEDNALYIGLTSNANPQARNGLAKINLDNFTLESFFDGSLGDQFAFNAKNKTICLSLPDTDKSVIQLHALTLKPIRTLATFKDGPDSVIPWDKNHVLALIESPNHGADFYRINTTTGALNPTELPSHFPARINVDIEVLPEDHSICVLQHGNDHSYLVRINPQGQINTVMLPQGIAWEMGYSPLHKTLFISSLSHKVLYAVDPQSLSIRTLKAPAGIREMAVWDSKHLILSDYFKGRVYIYNLSTQSVTYTLFVGRKPEALALNPTLGELYVFSSYGLSIFDLYAIKEDSHGAL